MVRERDVKKEWVRPLTTVQKFEANEYVAACGDSGVTYLFECTAGGGTHGSVYQETNGIDGLQTRRGWGYKADRELTGWPWDYYYACNEKHVAESTDEFLEGYYCPDDSTRKAQKVIIWRGENGRNIHCTTKLDKNSWETAKS